MDLGVRGKIALVTASSRGIGRAVSERLAGEGATVISAARSTDRQIEMIGDGQIRPLGVDLTEVGSGTALVDRVIAEQGRIDILVANTPGPIIKPALELSWDDWVEAHDLLLRPVVEMMTAAGRAMQAAGSGSMVLVSSTWVRQPNPGGTLSAAYRSAQSAFLKLLAGEVAPAGVRVNQVLVGATGTERMENIVASKAAAHGTDSDHEIAQIVKDIPLGRWGEAQEVGDAIAFLASSVPAFSTGSSFVIDGGAIRTAH